MPRTPFKWMPWISVVAAGLCLPAQAQDECGAWTAPFTTSSHGTSAAVLDIETWDPDQDGPLKPQLVIGGTFHRVGARLISLIAIRDRGVWKEKWAIRSARRGGCRRSRRVMRTVTGPRARRCTRAGGSAGPE